MDTAFSGQIVSVHRYLGCIAVCDALLRTKQVLRFQGHGLVQAVSNRECRREWPLRCNAAVDKGYWRLDA